MNTSRETLFSDDVLANDLLSLEMQLASGRFCKNSDVLDHLICDEFREIGSSGAVYTKQSVIEALAKTADREVVMSDFRVMRLSSSATLVTYHAMMSGTGTFRSSVWIFRDNCWKILFHQGTSEQRLSISSGNDA